MGEPLDQASADARQLVEGFHASDLGLRAARASRVEREFDFLMAVDAVNGKPLWRFPSNNVWRASPMTYMFDGKQHVAIASGANIISFALNE